MQNNIWLHGKIPCTEEIYPEFFYSSSLNFKFYKITEKIAGKIMRREIKQGEAKILETKSDYITLHLRISPQKFEKKYWKLLLDFDLKFF